MTNNSIFFCTECDTWLRDYEETENHFLETRHNFYEVHMSKEVAQLSFDKDAISSKIKSAKKVHPRQ